MLHRAPPAASLARRVSFFAGGVGCVVAWAALCVVVGAGCVCDTSVCGLDDVGAVPAHTIETGIAGAAVVQSDLEGDDGCPFCVESEARLALFAVEVPPSTPDEFRTLLQRSDVDREDVDIVGAYEHALDAGRYAVCAGPIDRFREVGCVNVVVVDGDVQTLHVPQGNHVNLVGGAAETTVNVENL